MIEPTGEERAGLVGSGGQSQSGQRIPPGNADGRWSIGRECWGEQKVGIFVAYGGKRRDHAGPVVDVILAEPAEKCIPAVGSKGIHQSAGESAGPDAFLVGGLEHVDKHRQGGQPGSGDFVGGRQPLGSGRTAEAGCCGGESLRISSPLAGGRRQGAQHVWRIGLVGLDGPPEPTEPGWVDGVAEIGEQFIATFLDGGHRIDKSVVEIDRVGDCIDINGSDRSFQPTAGRRRPGLANRFDDRCGEGIERSPRRITSF